MKLFLWLLKAHWVGTSVTFDALQSAKTKEMDVLIVDTAGRLHNKRPFNGRIAQS